MQASDTAAAIFDAERMMRPPLKRHLSGGRGQSSIAVFAVFCRKELVGSFLEPVNCKLKL
jgi:hypothetical protein